MRQFFRRILANVTGASLPTVILISGVVGSLSYSLIRMSNQQITDAKRAETRHEELSWLGTIAAELLNHDSCHATLGSVPLANNATLSGIYTRSGENLAVIGNTYGNRQLRLTSTYLSFAPTSLQTIPDSGGRKTGNINIIFELERTSNLIKGQSKITKRVAITATTDSSNNLVSCYSSQKNSVNLSKEQMCTTLGGIYSFGSCQVIPQVITAKTTVTRQLSGTAYTINEAKIYCPFGYTIIHCSGFASAGSPLTEPAITPTSINAQRACVRAATSGSTTTMTHHRNVTEYTVQARCLKILGNRCENGQKWNGTTCGCGAPRTTIDGLCLCPSSGLYDNSANTCT